MTQDYSTDVQNVVDAMNAVYENKQTNKKNSLSGDYSSDNASYPTCKAVKSAYGTKKTSFASTPSDSDVPSEKLVKDALDGKASNTHVHGNVSNDGKIGTTADLPLITTTGGAITVGSFGTSANTFCQGNDSRLSDARTPTSHTHGAISNDGKIGTDSGKIITTGTGGALQASSNLSTGDIKDSTAHSHIGSSADATQSTINSAIDNMVNLNIVKQATADTGYASTYYLTQNGVQVGAKINIEKDKMLRSISIETVGATPTQEETDAGMTTGDKYILMIVNTVDNDGTSRLILPITDVFDLQTADESTLTLSSGGVFSIKAGGVDTNQLKNGAVTSDKIASAVKSSWLSSSDVQSEISAFASALAFAISPYEPPL